MKKTTLLMMAMTMSINAMAQREKTMLDEGWRFSFGSASDPKKDFGCGTEYFNYLTKAAGIHNEGPYAPDFNDSTWQTVRVPHDWAAALPYAPEASHSHGYKTVGWKYPETSVGWYRLHLPVGTEDLGRHISVQFDGIFRNSQVWLNGIFMGTEPSGYAQQVYDITDYINYGGDNILTVRADASLEEGWFYEGAGIYRNAWLLKDGMAHVASNGTFAYSSLSKDMRSATLHVSNEIENSGLEPTTVSIVNSLYAPDGSLVATAPAYSLTLQPKEKREQSGINISVAEPQLWDIDNPKLYTLRTEVSEGGRVTDTYSTRLGIRSIEFTADEGFFINGRNVKLKGVNMHQDHAGVGAAMPKALIRWRIEQLKAMGCNAYRSSHNPVTPELLDVCDELGMLVIDENRLAGTNDYHRRLLENFIKRDRNHPSVIMWSASNEEWGLENNVTGTRIAASMKEIIARLDPSRHSTMANAGGPEQIKGADIIGYNYIVQNDVLNRRKANPSWRIYGSEETTGCGTRGVYFNSKEDMGHMASMNRTPLTQDWKVSYDTGSDTPDSYTQGVERGWKFYAETPWAAGCFFWTGFDYRGEPNPLSYPAHDSQFGLLDYCGFPKDEAYYLKAAWTDEPMVHLLPHWNLSGHEGDSIDVWAYSNCDEVELHLNGKTLGRKAMPKFGHITWKTTYRPGRLVATAYRDGKKVATDVVETTSQATKLLVNPSSTLLTADGNDVAVVNISLLDKKGRIVPDACKELTFTLSGEARIIGAGNGDPACKVTDHPSSAGCKEFSFPAFNGRAQLLVQTTKTPGDIKLTIKGSGIATAVSVLRSVSH